MAIWYCNACTMCGGHLGDESNQTFRYGKHLRDALPPESWSATMYTQDQDGGVREIPLGIMTPVKSTYVTGEPD